MKETFSAKVNRRFTDKISIHGKPFVSFVQFSILFPSIFSLKSAWIVLPFFKFSSTQPFSVIFASAGHTGDDEKNTAVASNAIDDGLVQAIFAF